MSHCAADACRQGRDKCERAECGMAPRSPEYLAAHGQISVSEYDDSLSAEQTRRAFWWFATVVAVVVALGVGWLVGHAGSFVAGYVSQLYR